jgi:uncharacterized integral membrane protein
VVSLDVGDRVATQVPDSTQHTVHTGIKLHYRMKTSCKIIIIIMIITIIIVIIIIINHTLVKKMIKYAEKTRVE